MVKYPYNPSRQGMEAGANPAQGRCCVSRKREQMPLGHREGVPPRRLRRAISQNTCLSVRWSSSVIRSADLRRRVRHRVCPPSSAASGRRLFSSAFPFFALPLPLPGTEGRFFTHERFDGTGRMVYHILLEIYTGSNVFTAPGGRAKALPE